MTRIRPQASTVKVPTAAPLSARAAGVLCHLSSLPGPGAIGDLGEEAHRFLDFLAAAGQRYWQMLPVNPVGDGCSPYGSNSSFAGEPLFIDPRGLLRDGLITKTSYAAYVRDSARIGVNATDYRKARALRAPLWREAAARFTQRRGFESTDYQLFREQNANWLETYAAFRVLGERYETEQWWQWPEQHRWLNEHTVAAVAGQHLGAFNYECFLQFQFEQQWQELRERARRRGVSLIGDLPIFVAHASADVWGSPHEFLLTEDGTLRFKAGVPPDYFCPEGQLWGNALYDWDAMARTNFRWWLARFARMLALFDVVRIDHFIGFHRAWHIPGAAKSAKNGEWRPIPGRALFEATQRELGGTPFIAEDLGSVTPEVWQLRDDFGMPGMRVLQFGFGTDEGAAYHRPHGYGENSVVYTGTHDNDTCRGWYRAVKAMSTKRSPVYDLARVDGYFGVKEPEIAAAMIRSAMASTPRTCIVPIQDHLGLGAKARMNIPGVAKGNWRFRLPPKALTPRLAAGMRTLTRATDRMP